MSYEALQQAAEFFLETVRKVRPDQWDKPALGVWTMRELVGHINGGVSGIERALGNPVDKAELRDIDYYLKAFAAANVHENVAQGGRNAGAALGDDPVATVEANVARVLSLVAERPGDGAYKIFVGTMTLGDFLAPRTLELVIHTLDVARAAGIDAQPPKLALQTTMRLLADLSVETGMAVDLALAATGRDTLPQGFSLMGIDPGKRRG
jgi:uncharacterized protein (TIGR03083 family)